MYSNTVFILRRFSCPIFLLKKLSLFGKDLNEFSLETVKMFYKDATEAGYEL